MNFVPLNIKTNNCLLSSMIKIKDLIKVAKENNIKCLTITDNNMYGVLDFYKECIKNNIKPIVGLEIRLEEEIILYAENYEGYQNLIKISTIMSSEPLTIKIIQKYSKNLLCIVPYTSRKLYNDLKKIYQDIFIGYKNNEEKAKIKSTNTIYMNKILCLNKEDQNYLKFLYAIKEGVLAKEIIYDFTNTSLIPLKNYNEPNNEKIIKLCNLQIKFHNKLMPVIDNSENILKEKCISSLKSIFGATAPKKYVERLKYELNTIKSMGYCDYFLIVEDYINYAKSHDILVGPGRGSAAGSLVSYLLNITTIDPLKYDLLFERFLNPERVTMPDIDVDFEDLKRDEVIKYCINKYGIKKVSPIITFGTLGPRQAVKDVGRVLDVNIKKVDILSKMIDPRISLLENYKQNRIKEFLNNHRDLQAVYKIAIKLEGLKRHASVHAAGIVMANDNLDEVIPLDKSHNNFYTTGYDMTYLEEIGLLKMDFLGLKNLNLISNILKEIPDLNFDNIPENDSKALNIFKTANTTGIFQFESDGMINFIKKLKPNTFNDIVAALALFRPGPMQNIDSYIKRKQGKEKINYIHPNLEKVLKPTYGIIIYQEQIMQIANIMAGYSFAEADILRRAMSKKKEKVLLKEKERFIKQSIQRGYTKEISTKVYDLILKFANYGFNKSHSVAYAMISYRMAYLKAHYPKIFIKNLLSSAISSDRKTKEYIYEAKINNIIITPPNINKSSENYIIDKETIIYPLTNIKNVGQNAAKTIIEERQKSPFKDIFDFVRRCYGKAVTRKVIENLILSGAFQDFGYNRKTLIENLENIINYGELNDEDIFKPEIERTNEYTKEEIMKNELEVFGFYISNHPITEYKTKIPNIIELKQVNNYFDKTIQTIIYVDRVKLIETKKKEKMMFITGSDELDKIDIVVFPKLFNENSNITEGDILQLFAKVEKRFDKIQLVASTIKKLN